MGSAQSAATIQGASTHRISRSWVGHCKRALGCRLVAYGDLLLPLWRNPTILFIVAPLTMLLGVVAAADGAPIWLMVLVELASIPLLVLGFFAVEEV